MISYERVRFTESEGGRAKTIYLKNPEVRGPVLSGIEVNKEGAEVAPRGYDERLRLIDLSLVSSRTPMVVDRHYGWLVEAKKKQAEAETSHSHLCENPKCPDWEYECPYGELCGAPEEPGGLCPKCRDDYLKKQASASGTVIGFTNVTQVAHANPRCGLTRNNRYYNTPKLLTPEQLASHQVCERCGHQGFPEATHQSIFDAWNEAYRAARGGLPQDYVKGEIAKMREKLKTGKKRTAFVLTPQQRDDIMRLRREIVDEGEVNFRGGPSCGITSEEVALLLGGQEFYGAYQTDHMGAPEHAWVVMGDGTIVDPTADQFGGEPIEVIPPGDPRQSRYLDQEGDDLKTGKKEAASKAGDPFNYRMDGYRGTVVRVPLAETGEIVEFRIDEDVDAFGRQAFEVTYLVGQGPTLIRYNTWFEAFDAFEAVIVSKPPRLGWPKEASSDQRTGSTQQDLSQSR